MDTALAATVLYVSESDDELYLARTERVADGERLALGPGSVVHSGLPPGRVADHVVFCGRRHDGDEGDDDQEQAARSSARHFPGEMLA
jgi:hypothetical protein